MLQAIGRGKLTRFLGKTPEDAVTDCVFGALRYLDPRDAGVYLHWIIPHSAIEDVDVETVELWPPRQNGREPDALLQCRKPNGAKVRVLIEVKWGGYTLDSQQAIDQWRGFILPQIGKIEPVHAFVVDKIDKATYQIEHDEAAWGSTKDVSIWRKSRVVISWHDVARALQQRRKQPDRVALERLAEDVLRTLRALGKRPFDGFGRTHAAAAVTVPADRIVFGRHGRQFKWPTLDVQWTPNLALRISFDGRYHGPATSR
ncbi:MAG: hypothetical protein JO264_16580 [Acidisphaera sp.]|nr:hypothetical protein [Acidisphaera sp.]